MGGKASSQRERIHELLSEIGEGNVIRWEQEQKRKCRETTKENEEGTEGADRRT